jgi:hypothetical protein
VVPLTQGVKAHLLGEHHLDKLVVVDDTVSVLVGFADHFVDLGVRQLFAEVGYIISAPLVSDME